MSRVRRPDDLFGLGRTRASVLRGARLETEHILDIWTRFDRSHEETEDLPLPAAEVLAAGVARLRLRAPAREAHLRFSVPALAGEHFVGFGERFNALDQHGQRLEVWTEEGSFGTGERLSPLLDAAGSDANPFPKGPVTACKPLPWYISSRGYGLCVNTSYPVFYDVAATEAGRLTIEVAAPEAELLLFYDADPAQLVERFTAHFGRPRGLPDWAYAPWVDAIEGSAEVRRVADLVRREKIPCSVMWTEDWSGGHWEPWLTPGSEHYSLFPTGREADRVLYPDLEALAGQLHAQGFKFLGYYYPYVAESDPGFAKAEAAGYFLRRTDGSLAEVPIVGHRSGQVDLTNPAARVWYEKELRRSIDLGFDGWMADFGEYTPIESVAFDGQIGLAHHNRYPGLWAQFNREVLEKARPDGDFVFFSRSGSLGSQAHSPVVWTGDSDTNFERWDGLPSNLPAMLSAGLSGFAIWTVDVGGYMSLFTEDRDAETLARWAELAALLPVMRTHHGTQPKASVQFHRDPGALAHFARWARVHAALFPHLRTLVDEACATGLPVCRPLLLHYPGDETSWRVADQFLCGPDLLVAPVVTRGARERRVYLPPGRDWIDLWTGYRHDGGTTVMVAAPIGVLPMFLAADGLLVTVDTYADTYMRRAQVTDPMVRTLEDAEMSVALLAGPAFTGPHRLYDGSIIRLAGATGGCREPNVGQGPPLGTEHGADLELAAMPVHPHELLPADLTGPWGTAVSATGSGGTVELADGRRLNVHAPRTRRWTLYGFS